MVSRRRLLGSVAGALAAPTGTAAGLGVPLGEPWRRDAPYDDVRVAASDGTLYVAATDGETTAVEALPGVDAAPRWRATVDGAVRGVVATSEGLWLVDDRPRIHRLDGEEGDVETVFQHPAGGLGPPTRFGDAVAVGHDLRRGRGPLSADGIRGTVRVVDPAGQRWAAEHLGPVGRPATDGNGVFVAVLHRETDDLDAGRVVGRDAGDGDRRWATDDVGATGALAATGGVLAAGTSDGTVLGLDAGDGGELWRRELDGAVERLAVTPDGRGVVALADGGAVGIATDGGDRRWGYAPSAEIRRIAVHGETVWLRDADEELTALRPDGDGVAWRGDVGLVGWPPAVVDGGLVLPDDGAVVIHPGVARAADRRLRALDASPLSALDPVAAPLGYDDVRREAERADREGDHQRAYRAASRVRRRRRIAAALTGLLGLGAVGSGAYAGDRLRLRWRRYRGLRRRHARLEDRIAAVEKSQGGGIPALRAAHGDAAPGPLADPETARRGLDELEEHVATAEDAVDRRDRLRDRLDGLGDTASGHPWLGSAYDAVRSAVAAADLGAADDLADVRRIDRRLRRADEAAAGLAAVDRDALDRLVPLDEPPLEEAAPAEIGDALDGEDLRATAEALERLAVLLAALDGRAAEDAAALRRVGDGALHGRYVDAVERADVDALERCRGELDRRAELADRREALLARLDGRDAVGGVPIEPSREAVAAVDVTAPDDAAATLDVAERALDAAGRLADLEEADVAVDLEGCRDALVAAVEAGDGDAVDEAAADVDRLAAVVERAEEAGAALGRMVLTYADRDREDVEDAVERAVADRDRHALERLIEELGRLREHRWTQRRLAGMSDDAFAALVAELWSSLGWDAEARWSDGVVAEDGETLLIACYPYPRDRPVRRDDVEHQLDRRRKVDADRLLVVTSSEPSDGVLATAEHGWRDVRFMSGAELRDLLDGSPIVPPR